MIADRAGREAESNSSHLPSGRRKLFSFLEEESEILSAKFFFEKYKNPENKKSLFGYVFFYL